MSVTTFFVGFVTLVLILRSLNSLRSTPNPFSITYEEIEKRKNSQIESMERSLTDVTRLIGKDKVVSLLRTKLIINTIVRAVLILVGVMILLGYTK